MDKLGASDGVAYLTKWVRERCLDVQVVQVGRSLSEFFRKLPRKTGQSLRDYIVDQKAQTVHRRCCIQLPCEESGFAGHVGPDASVSFLDSERRPSRRRSEGTDLNLPRKPKKRFSQELCQNLLI